MVGIIRSLQLVGTLVAAGPIALMGVITISTGGVVRGVVFLGFAVGIVLVSEYMYVRIVSGTVGRMKRLGGLRSRIRRFRN